MEMAVEVDKTYLATQTEDADILGQNYRPVNTTKEIQLGLENNVITFEYIPYTTSKITVNYRDMDGNLIGSTKQKHSMLKKVIPLPFRTRLRKDSFIIMLILVIRPPLLSQSIRLRAMKVIWKSTSIIRRS